jgi:O-methyltransferase/methyltransferase family protein
MSTLPPPFALLDMIMGSMVTQAIHVAAKLDVAEQLADGPLPADEIARRCGADADAVYRVLRVLATRLIFAQDEDGRFRLTPMAEALRDGAPVSMRAMALLLGHPFEWEHWGELTSAVTTGEPVLPRLRQMGGYEFLAANPEFAGVFEAGMDNLSTLETEPIVAAYDFSGFETIVDVFGGRGTLLAAILAGTPGVRGVLADQRAEMLGAEEFLRSAGVGDRCAVDTAGLFEKPPAGADVYLMKHIVHEWPEQQALELLRNVRASIRDDGRLLLMEFVLPEGSQPHPGVLVDLWLMILMGGKERTRSQYTELLRQAGFRLTRVIETGSPVAIVEAVPA